MATDLVYRSCKPCEGGVDPLTAEQIAMLLEAVHDDWQLDDEGIGIERRVAFPAYSRSLGFANAVAWIAIVEGHHPDMTLGYDYCTVRYTTHAVGGLTDNDFICAAKVDRLLDNAK